MASFFGAMIVVNDSEVSTRFFCLLHVPAITSMCYNEHGGLAWISS